MTLREEIIQGLMAGGMPREEASAKVKRLVEESRSKGWSDGYREGIDEGLNQAGQ